jgi:hypothetical protein
VIGISGRRGAVIKAYKKELVERIYKYAKSSDHTLSEAETLECVQPAR